MNITARIKTLIDYLGLSVRAFAIGLGMNQQTLDRQLKSTKGINVETIEAILRKYQDVSAEWLMRGTGDMLISSTKVYIFVCVLV